MNRMFLLMQPASKSNRWCTTCQHVYDPIYRICTCDDSKELPEENDKTARRIVNFDNWIKEKSQ